MPRKLRLEYPGAIYHVMSRGNRREDIFLDDVDRQDFLKTLAEAEAERIYGLTPSSFLPTIFLPGGCSRLTLPKNHPHCRSV